MNESSWTSRRLEEVASFEYGVALPGRSRTGDHFPVFGSNGEVGRHGDALVPGPGIIVGRKGTVGALAWSQSDFWPIDTTFYVRARQDIDMRWLYWALSTLGLTRLDSSTGVPGLNRHDAYRIRFLVPPIEEQRRIAEILNTLDAQISATKQLLTKLALLKQGMAGDTFVASYSGNSAHSKLGDIVEIRSGGTPSRANPTYWTRGTVPWVKTAEINSDLIQSTSELITHSAVADAGLRVFPAGTILIAMYGQGSTRGRAAMLGLNACVNQACAALAPAEKRVDPSYLFQFLLWSYEAIRSLGQGSNQTNLSASLLKNLRVPLPSLDVQREVGSALRSLDAQNTAERRRLDKFEGLKSGLTSDLLTGRVRVPAEVAS
jgi:type I restriction enzyme S subunit